jgi:TatD DNase family protein
MKLIDSHAHLDFEDFHNDFDAVLCRAEEAGIEKIINIGTSLDRSRASVTLADNYPNIYATVGVHPEEAGDIDLENVHAELLNLAKSSKKVVGIGETGLDYNAHGFDKEEQIKLFQIQIEVAHHLGLPLVIHIRNGEDEEAVATAYEILKESGHSSGVIHCFTFNKDWAKRFIDLGFHLGFTGIITYKNAEEIREAAKSIPLDRILIETDCPFLSPQEYRGTRNESAYVLEVAKKIAEIRNLPLEQIAEITFTNTQKLFQLR